MFLLANPISVMQEKINIPTYGLELEKVFTTHDGTPYPVGDTYFMRLNDYKKECGEDAELKRIGGVIVEVSYKDGVESLDNSFLLGESSTRPVTTSEGGLFKLAEIVDEQVKSVTTALEEENASILNMSNHPLTEITQEVYEKYVVPKPVYEYMRNVRGWNHRIGINAKAQNSPSTGVSIENASEALNSVIGLGAVFVALYGNSPFAEGKISSHKESRLLMWDEMFSRSPFPCDYNLSKMPEKPFDGLSDYFNWMFGDKTSMYFIVTGDDGRPPKNEKGNARFTRVNGDPSMLHFMQADDWEGTDTKTGEKVKVIPHVGHFVMNQFAHFSAARIRYGLHKNIDIDPKLISSVIRAGNTETEKLFKEITDYVYIEGRDPGANFPDSELRDVDNNMANTVLMSPSALQAGIISNIRKSSQLWRKVGWDNLKGLREAAIKYGMQAEYNGHKVYDVASEMIEIAAEGLDEKEQYLLAYPSYVLSTKSNGAERALTRFGQLHGSEFDRIKQITKERIIVL